VTCPRAFRLRRLAQSRPRPVLDQGVPAGLQHFTCKFSHRMTFVKRPSAFRLCSLAHKVCVAVLAPSILPVNSRAKWRL
jgi:hypothetical protein